MNSNQNYFQRFSQNDSLTFECKSFNILIIRKYSFNDCPVQFNFDFENGTQIKNEKKKKIKNEKLKTSNRLIGLIAIV